MPEDPDVRDPKGSLGSSRVLLFMISQTHSGPHSKPFPVMYATWHLTSVRPLLDIFLPLALSMRIVLANVLRAETTLC